MKHLDPPPTLAEYHEADIKRNLTDGPLGGKRRRPGVRYTPVGADHEPDILRRLDEPIPGERTPAQAALLRRLKALIDGERQLDKEQT